MNKELTNEAAEMIGQYTKGGKNAVLKYLMENGGIVKKEVENGGGRKKGFEHILYYYPDGRTACYDPVRVEIMQNNL